MLDRHLKHLCGSKISGWIPIQNIWNFLGSVTHWLIFEMKIRKQHKKNWVRHNWILKSGALASLWCPQTNPNSMTKVMNVWYICHKVLRLKISSFSCIKNIENDVPQIFTPWCNGVWTILVIIAFNDSQPRLDKSSPPRDTYRRQWIASALVQIMTSRLFGAKPLSKLMLCYCQLDLKNKLKWNFNQNTKIFIHENTSENIVCEMAAILSRAICV